MVQSDDTEYELIPFDEPVKIVQGAAWDELVPTLDPVFADVLPDSGAFGTTWWFDSTENRDPSIISPDEDCPSQVGQRPASMVARFAMLQTFTPDELREGTLEIMVEHGDRESVASSAELRRLSVDCLADGLRADISLVKISEGLPDHATVAYRIEYEPTGPDEDGIERFADVAVVQLHRDEIAVQVFISAIQPEGHPDWIDVDAEAIRIASTLRLGP